MYGSVVPVHARDPTKFQHQVNPKICIKNVDYRKQCSLKGEINVNCCHRQICFYNTLFAGFWHATNGGSGEDFS